VVGGTTYVGVDEAVANQIATLSLFFY